MKNRIKELREQRGWTTTVLGERLGVTASAVSKLEKGGVRLHLEWIERAAKAFGVDAIEIVDDQIVGRLLPSRDDVKKMVPSGEFVQFSRYETDKKKLFVSETDEMSEVGIVAERSLLIVETHVEWPDIVMGDVVVVQARRNTDGAPSVLILREFIEPRVLVTNTRQTISLPLHLGDARFKLLLVGRVEHHLSALSRTRLHVSQ